jgi:hypothetical protein
MGFNSYGRVKLNRVLKAHFVVGKKCTYHFRRLDESPAARRDFDYCVLDPIDLLAMTDLFVLCITFRCIQL